VVLEKNRVIYGHLKDVVSDAFEKAKKGELHGVFVTVRSAVPYAYIIKSALRRLLENENQIRLTEAQLQMPYFALMNPREKKSEVLKSHIQKNLNNIIDTRKPQNLNVMVFDESYPVNLVNYECTGDYAGKMIRLAYLDMHRGTEISVFPVGVAGNFRSLDKYNPLLRATGKQGRTVVFRVDEMPPFDKMHTMYKTRYDGDPKQQKARAVTGKWTVSYKKVRIAKKRYKRYEKLLELKKAGIALADEIIASRRFRL